jgi:membrane-bound lytic murein transglycosylase D
MRITSYWKKRLRREMPIILLGATVATGTMMRDDGPVTPALTSAVGEQLTYLEQSVPLTETAKPFTKTALGAQSIADMDHKFVSKWVSTFTGARKHDLETTLDRMEPYTAMIERKLEERGMPQELVYLALIESGGNPKALSPVKARGLWQFMTPTAKQYGLKVARGVDERTNPEKATDAALDYLSDLHKRFGSWYLAAAAYNSGQGRVSKILKQVTGKSKGTDEDFYRIAGRLPKETRDYVPKLVAVARIAKQPTKYGFTD